MGASAAASTGAQAAPPPHSISTPQSLAFEWLYHEGNPSQNIYEFLEQYALATVFFSLTQARTSEYYMNLHEEDNGTGDNGTDVNGVDSFLMQARTSSDNGIGSFTEQKEVCGWTGVRCVYNYTTDTVHVTELDLANKGLTGSIPDEIAFLPYLTRLDLSDNEVKGTIPEGVYELKYLR